MSVNTTKNHDLIWARQENFELDAHVVNEYVTAWMIYSHSDKEEYYPGWRSHDVEAVEVSLGKVFF